MHLVGAAHAAHRLNGSQENTSCLHHLPQAGWTLWLAPAHAYTETLEATAAHGETAIVT